VLLGLAEARLGLREGLGAEELAGGVGLGLGEALVANFLSFAGVDRVLLRLDGGEGAEEELGEIADGEGVAAVDAAVGELLGDVGEESVDAIGGIEIAGSGEEFGGEDFGIGLVVELGKGLRLAKVIGAERFVVDAEHAAVLAAGRDVLALTGGDDGGRRLRGHKSSFRDVK
jgi:hypothetical protein